MMINIATLAWRNIRTRRARSWLTVLGMLIGVVAIVTLISVGTGVENAVLQQFEDVGLDVVLLVPREIARRASSIQEEISESRHPASSIEEIAIPIEPEGGTAEIDGEAFEDPLGSHRGLNAQRLKADVPEVTDVAQVATTDATLSVNDVAGYVTVIAPSWELIHQFDGLIGGFKISEGDSFAGEDDTGVILGARMAELTGTAVNDAVTIDGHQLIVRGILTPSEQSQILANPTIVRGQAVETIESLTGTDDAVFILERHAQLLWPELAMSSIVAIRIRTGVSVEETLASINAAVSRQGLLMTPVSTQDLADNVQRTLGMVKVVLASIAAVSLLVGCIGMMNTMYTSVLERTREIGILKSVGAKDKHVLYLFLVDSGLMGLTGGILGLGLGIGTSFLGTSLLGGLIGVTSFSPYFAPWLLLGSIALSFALGSLAGVWPAWHAARFDPVRALAAD